jgi:8-oxo-dGTP pyrophosphatase MutT (NUDIX family)/predicted ATPase
MRVYLVGSHSVGKTTLARYISKAYNLPLRSEAARAVAAERETVIDALRASIEETDAFQSAVFERQLVQERDAGDFVSDRSFDNLAYAASHSRIFRETVSSEAAKAYIERLRKSDVLIFFVRPSPDTMQSDGMRERPDWEAIIRIDAQVKMLLELYGLPYVQISTSSQQERVRLIDSVMALFQRVNSREILKRASCVLALNDEGKILTVGRKTDTENRGIPGGKKDLGESHAEAAARELLEETGMTLEHPFLVACLDDGFGYYVETYVGNVIGTPHTTEAGGVFWDYPKVAVNEKATYASHNRRLFRSIGMPAEAYTSIPTTDAEREAHAKVMTTWWATFTKKLEESNVR